MHPDEAQQTWQILADQVETFIERWEKGDSTPQLADFLPDESGPLRQLALVELIKVDLEYRWQRCDLEKRLEAYADEFPELKSEGGMPCDLIFEEYHVRCSAGDGPDPQEYLERFPQQAAQLKKLLQTESTINSTAMFSGQRIENVAPGDRLDDFDLLALLGKGAFARVFLARQISMQRMVALKISCDKGTEPQTLAQLDHPGIVRVYDQRKLGGRQLRLLYMQYVAGGTLHDVVRRLKEIPAPQRTGRNFVWCIEQALDERGESPPSNSPARRMWLQSSWPEVVCRLGAHLASALDYAWHQGVLHRDIKPANVLVAADGTPKLADFNISFSSQVEGTVPAAYFGGSLAYMSPEQLEASNPAHHRQPQELDGRSDMYSLGVVLWELLHGERPFLDRAVPGGWSAMLDAMVDRRREALANQTVRAASGETLPELQQILVRCMHPDPSQRWADNGQLARQLQLCLHPEAQRLLHPSQRLWRRVVVSLPLITLLVVLICPNALMAWFNLNYNIEKVIPPAYRTTFDIIQMTINGIAFPIGIAMFSWLVWPVARGVSGCREPSKKDSGVRDRAIRLGEIGAIIGVILWVTAGIAYPVTVRLTAGPLPAGADLHLFASLTLCGLMAAAYPYFAISFVAIRALYPVLLSGNVPPPPDRGPLLRLGRVSGAYLLVAGIVPMLAIVLLVMTGSAFHFAFRVLSVVGLLGFPWAFVMYRALQRAIIALAAASDDQSAPQSTV